MAEAERTTAVEGLALTLKDQASAPAEKVASAFERVHHASERAREKVGEFARSAAMGALGAVGLGLGFREIWEKAKDANLELENAAKHVAGVHFAFGGWRSDVSATERWNYSLSEGTEIVEKLEGAESRLHKTRGELANVYKSAYAIGTRHNLNQQQMLDLTEKLASSEIVLGTSAEMAALSISRAVMTGNIRGFDEFNKHLKFSVGNMKEFHKMSEGARFARIQKALGDLRPAAEGMGQGIAGAMADIRIAVDNITRDLSGPVFQDVAKSLKSWAHEISHVREDGKSIASEYGRDLVSAFHTLKDVTAFLYDHWKEIAAIWGSMKFASWMGPGAFDGGAAGGAGTVVTTVTGRLSEFARKLAAATGALTAWYLLLEAGASKLDKWQTGHIQTQARWGAGSVLEGSTGKTAARHMEAFRGMLGEEGFQTDYKDAMAKAKEAFISYQAAYGADVISRAGVNKGQASAAWGAMSEDARAKQATALGLASSATGQEFVNKLDEMVKLLSGLLPTVATATDPHLNKKGPPVINIGHVAFTQEFKEADPDRVFHKAINEIDHMVNAPRGATTNALGA